MKEQVFLEYCFLFDPSSTWTNLYQFEEDLLKFFNEHNMNAEAIKTVSGYNGRRIIHISAKEQVAVNDQKEDVSNSPKMQLSPKEQAAKLASPVKNPKRGKKGTYK